MSSRSNKAAQRYQGASRSVPSMAGMPGSSLARRIKSQAAEELRSEGFLRGPSTRKKS